MFLPNQKSDFVVIGGGIIGLATAFQILRRFPGQQVLVLEKEETIASHQTGHNSGVIHSGLYYQPGSQKAQTCTQGRKALLEFSKNHNIPYEICGKILVATNDVEKKRLNKIEENGRANGLTGIKRLKPKDIQDLEPHCRGIAGLNVPETGIINFSQVAQMLVNEIHRLGESHQSRVHTNTCVKKIHRRDETLILHTSQGKIQSRFLINCAGLQTDRIAKKDGFPLSLRIVPFRGDYYELKIRARHKVKNLIYPVPDPNLPFLGVHFTRLIDGSVECGPNAVFSFKREGYSRWSFNPKDSWDALTFPGTWKLFYRHWRYGLDQLHQAISKKHFIAAAQKLIPDLQEEDVVEGRSGVRAQAVDTEGQLINDFRLETTANTIHVLNAPSPAATASLAIGQRIVDKLQTRFERA